MSEVNLIDYAKYDSDDVEKYKEDTIFKPGLEMMEEEPNYGTIKITEEVAKQAILAMKERIEATKDYTEARIIRIKQLLEGKIK